VKTHHPQADPAQLGLPAWLTQQQGPRNDPRAPVVYGRYTFRHATGPAGQRPGPPANNPLRRAPRGASTRVAQQQQVDMQDDLRLEDDTDDMDGRGRDGQGFDADLGSDKHRGFAEREDADDDARRRALQNVRVPQRRKAAPPAHVLARSGLPGAAALFVPPAPGTRLSMDRFQALATVLLACARQAHPREPGKPSPSASLLAAVQQHLISQTSAPPASLTLDDVKALLMSLPETAPPPADALRERVENALLLLPLHILSAGRRRTPTQRRQTIDRLHVLRNSPGLA